MGRYFFFERAPKGESVSVERDGRKNRMTDEMRRLQFWPKIDMIKKIFLRNLR